MFQFGQTNKRRTQGLMEGWTQVTQPISKFHFKEFKIVQVL